MTTSLNERCGVCKFYRAKLVIGKKSIAPSREAGSCHRYPVAAEIAADYWCGEFKLDGAKVTKAEAEAARDARGY